MNTLSRLNHRMSGTTPVTALEYRDAVAASGPFPPSLTAERNPTDHPQAAVQTIDERTLTLRLEEATRAAVSSVEEKLRQDFRKKIEEERMKIAAALVSFERERREYYAQVEPEIVHLILAVAGKILHREVQVDRMLLAALAKIAIEGLQQRSQVVLRVPPQASADWRSYFVAELSGVKVEVVEDSQLPPEGCVLETELGSADMSLNAQLKEIERGFFDLLAKRPEIP